MTPSNADRVRTLLKGIETGDPAAVEVIHPDIYIQHNPQTHEGRAGLAALFARLAKGDPRVNIVRAFEDGDFVFAHTEYDFASRRIGFEVFRFDGGFAVEHWDNIQPRQGPNASGRSMVDGPVEAGDPARTEDSRARVHDFVEEVLIGRREDRLEHHVDAALIQHSPGLGDGAGPWRAALFAPSHGAPVLTYHRLHRVLARGDFALAVSEGDRDGVHSAFYDLFRIAGGKLAEHWDTVEAVPPASEWKNDNGKF